MRRAAACCGARRTVEEDRAYLWSRCSIEDRLFVLFRFARASARWWPIAGYLPYAVHNGAHAQIFWARPISNAHLTRPRKIFYTCRDGQCDFPPFCIKHVVAAAVEPSTTVALASIPALLAFVCDRSDDLTNIVKLYDPNLKGYTNSPRIATRGKEDVPKKIFTMNLVENEYL